MKQRLKPITEIEYKERLGKAENSPRESQMQFFKIISKDERETIKRDIEEVLKIHKERKRKKEEEEEKKL